MRTEKTDRILIDAVLAAHGGDYDVEFYSDFATIFFVSNDPVEIVRVALEASDSAALPHWMLAYGSIWPGAQFTFYTTLNLGKHYKEKKND
jgi:hypothetical protein